MHRRAPVRRNQRLYNCGIVLARGKILGVVPKSFLPNYREFYDNRWFSPGAGLTGLEISLAGQVAPFGADLYFAASDFPDFTFHIELCEDFWVATPPSFSGALAGALILCNLSASNVVVGKSEDRAMLCASQSVRCLAAHAYSAAGPGESTTDLAWDGQATIHELGALLAQTERFPSKGQLAVADVDVERLRLERMRTVSFNAASVAAGHPESSFRRVAFEHRPHSKTWCWYAKSIVFRMFPMIRVDWIRIAMRHSVSRYRGSLGASYALAEIKKWLGVFLYRFFEVSQFKRSALPNGPKVVSGGSLSPRGDWRAPSDGNATVWLDELNRNVPG